MLTFLTQKQVRNPGAEGHDLICKLQKDHTDCCVGNGLERHQSGMESTAVNTVTWVRGDGFLWIKALLGEH